MLVFDGESRASVLRFTPDGTRLVVAPYGRREIDVWTLATGECVRCPDQQVAYSHPALAVHPSGRTAFVARGRGLTQIALAGGPSVAIAGNSSARIFGIDNVFDVATSRDGEWVVLGSGLGPAHRLLGFRCTAEGELQVPTPWVSNPYASHEFLIGPLGATDRFLTVGTGAAIVVREFSTGKVVSTTKFPAHHLHARAVSPDGTRVAVMGYDKLYLWDAKTWAKPMRVPGYVRPLTALMYHPTRPIIAAIQSLQTLVKFLDADTGAVLRKFQWKLGEMESVCFSPDGTLAAAGAANGKIVVWDVEE